MNKLLKQAFTLIELLVVIAIIGILSGLIIVGMNGMTSSANIAKSQVFSNSLRNSLLMNMTGEWKFDNMSGTIGPPLDNGTSVPDSWLTNNGSTYGGPKLKDGKDCALGKCLFFDGNNDYVSIPNTPSSTTGTTISIWAKPIALSVAAKLIVSPNILVALATSGTIWTYVDTVAQGWHFSGATSIAYSWINDWHFIVVTYSASTNTIKYYRDGIEVYTNSLLSTGNLAQITSTAILGLEDSMYFNGSIDDVRIFNAVMPASYIKEQYYAGLNSLLSSGQINAKEYSEKINSIAGK